MPWLHDKLKGPEYDRAWQTIWNDMADLREGQLPWSRARGPMGATILHLTELGWDVQDPLKLTDPQGSIWEYALGKSIRPMQEAIQAQVQASLWQHALQHRHSRGLSDQGPDLTIIRKHYRWFIKQDRSGDAGLFLTIATGATWPLERRQAAFGNVQNMDCPVCGLARHTDFHTYWGCAKLAESTN